MKKKRAARRSSSNPPVTALQGPYSVVLGRGRAPKSYTRYLDRLYERALRGNASAQWEIGFRLEEGEPFEKNPSLAVRWYRSALDNGFMPAANALAHAYLDGIGVRRDRRRAIRLYQHAANAGDAAALGNLGRCYLLGLGVPKDTKRGLDLMRRSAMRGFTVAADQLGNAFAHGDGVRKNNREAAKWYEVAARAGEPEAAMRLATLLEDSHAKSAQGKAFRWMTIAAEARLPDALHALGWYYENGIGTPSDVEKALKAYRQATAQGNASSAFNIALIYWRRGKTSRALQWFDRASKLGHEVAEAFVRTRDASLLKPYG